MVRTVRRTAAPQRHRCDESRRPLPERLPRRCVPVQRPAHSAAGGRRDLRPPRRADAAIDADPNDDLEPFAAPAAQSFYKPLSDDGSKPAVLLMNAGTASESMTVEFKYVPGLKCTKCTVRDIHAHKDLGSFTDKWTGPVEGHDVAFLVITA